MAHIQAPQNGSDGNATVQKIEIPFELYYGIGSFPIKTTDKLYKDEIIAACLQRYGFDLTPYYYPADSDGDNTKGQEIHLFDVIDLTARDSHLSQQRFKRKMRNLREFNANSHSSYFYIFIRPIQILLIAALLGYALYLASVYEYGDADDEDEATEEQDRRGMRGGGDDDYDY